MNRLLKGVVLAMSLSLTACAGSGSINWDSARQVKPGMTKQEVTALMGRPYKVAGLPDHTERWVWVHVNALAGGTQSAALTFKDGKVTEALPVPDSF